MEEGHLQGRAKTWSVAARRRFGFTLRNGIFSSEQMVPLEF